MTRRYYATELEAHDAARAESRTSPMGMYVDDDHNGFFVTPLGRPGTSCYMAGHHESEIDDDAPVDRLRRTALI